jgi:hypothetical protein
MTRQARGMEQARVLVHVCEMGKGAGTAACVQKPTIVPTAHPQQPPASQPAHPTPILCAPAACHRTLLYPLSKPRRHSPRGYAFIKYMG